MYLHIYRHFDILSSFGCQIFQVTVRFVNRLIYVYNPKRLKGGKLGLLVVFTKQCRSSLKV